MTERAAELGVDLLWRTVVTSISSEAVNLADRTVGAKWIIGADGGNSRVRRWARLDTYLREGLRYAFPRTMRSIERKYPKLVANHDRVAERPQLAAYLSSKRRIPFNQQGIFRHYAALDA